MGKIIKKLFSPYINDIASQIAFPTKSFSGNLIRKFVAHRSKALNKVAVEQFSPKNGDNYLEIGFGRGDGLEIFHNLIKSNNVNAKLFGIEASLHALDKALHKFALEVDDQEMTLERCPQLSLLPFPNNFFDGIYHVDVFYYWPTQKIPNIEREIFRILKPNSKLVCTMDLNRLRKWEEWDLISSKEFDVMRYVEWLEPCGFENVNIKYINVSKDREIQLITANKPEKEVDDDDPEKKLKQLEMDIKYQMFADALLNKKPLDIDN